MANYRPCATGRSNDPSEAELRQFLTGEGRGMIEYPVGKRALSKGTTTAGGFTVPTSFCNTLMEHLVSASAIRGASTILPTTSGEDVQMPATTSYSSAVLVAEAAALTASDPVFAQVTLKAYKYGCMI